RKRRRARIISGTVVWALLDAVLTAVTVALDLPSVVKNSPGAPSWMYVVDAAIWLLVTYWGVRIWRSRSKRLPPRIWRSNTQLDGRHQDEVGPGGVRCIAPGGIQKVIPWTSIDYIRETKNFFHLIDHHGDMQAGLPKRGLPSPDLIPELREFLNQSVNG